MYATQTPFRYGSLFVFRMRKVAPGYRTARYLSAYGYAAPFCALQNAKIPAPSSSLISERALSRNGNVFLHKRPAPEKIVQAGSRLDREPFVVKHRQSILIGECLWRAQERHRRVSHDPALGFGFPLGLAQFSCERRTVEARDTRGKTSAAYRPGSSPGKTPRAPASQARAQEFQPPGRVPSASSPCRSMACDRRCPAA